MLKKVYNALSANFGYKLLSILVAIVIWYAVVDINDPVETSSYTVRISVANESYIASGKQIYHIDDQYKSVTVYIKGNRNSLKRISADDITVTADLTQIVDLERDPVMVPLTAACAGVNPTNITLSRTAIPITIENIASKQFAVSVDMGDSVPGSSFEVGTTTPNPEQIVINGPESVVNEIESVVAKIDVTGMTQDGTKVADLKLFDRDSREISNETIEDDLTFDGGMPNITVYVDLWKKQSGVTLSIGYIGVPATGYHVVSTVTTPETVTVVGNDSALAELAENKNVLTMESDVSVTGATDNVSASLNLTDMLPSGLRLASTMADTVTVTFNILSDETREVDIDVDAIQTRNLAADLTVSYDQAELTIRITGMESAIRAVNLDDITAAIDLKDKVAGDYTVPVNVTLPSGVSLEQSVQISIHLKEKATETSPTPETEGN